MLSLRLPLSRGKVAQNRRKTGEYIWKDVDDPVYVDKRTGKVKERTQPSTKMAEAKDAYTLVSEADTPVERAYANYANKMKALGNQARLEILSTGKVPYSATAKRPIKLRSIL